MSPTLKAYHQIGSLSDRLVEQSMLVQFLAVSWSPLFIDQSCAQACRWLGKLTSSSCSATSVALEECVSTSGLTFALKPHSSAHPFFPRYHRPNFHRLLCLGRIPTAEQLVFNTRGLARSNTVGVENLSYSDVHRTHTANRMWKAISTW